MVVLSDVSKSYGGSIALQPTTLSFDTGRTTVLIGPSGCGKSTILRLINGLILPTSGTIEINKVALNGSSLTELRRVMGYVIQEGGLFPHLTSRENISLLAKHIHVSAEGISSRINELCSLTHFDNELLDRYPSELSGGQRQRVSIMRALMLDPPILLFDEPLAALDPMVRFALQQELKQIFEKLHKTVILVTHDLPEAAYFADTIILMNKGEVVQIGTMSELHSRPRSDFVTSFIAAQRTLASI